MKFCTISLSLLLTLTTVTPPAHAAANLKGSSGAGLILLNTNDQHRIADVFVDLGLGLRFNRFTRLGFTVLLPDRPKNTTDSSSPNHYQAEDGLLVAGLLNLQHQIVETRNYRLFSTLGLSQFSYLKGDCGQYNVYENGHVVASYSYYCRHFNNNSRGYVLGLALEPRQYKPLRFEYLYSDGRDETRMQVIRAGINF